MKRKRFTEEQIIGVLKEAEAGVETGDLDRRHGNPRRRSTTGRPVRRHGSVCGKRLRSLEDEHAKLKRLLADAMLDNAALKDLHTKKW